jgi:SSS family solute:Na+ symporter
VTLLAYLFFGGMFAIAFTDLLQAAVVVCGLLYIAGVVAGKAGGVANVFAAAAASGKLVVLPDFHVSTLITAFAAFATTAFGSIAQQDVFQRVTSAKDETTAMRGTLFGGIAYFIIAFVPMFIGMSAFLIDPEMVTSMLGNANEFQLILPQLILRHAPLPAQVIFFGALLGAILSSGSGAILAPTAIFTENILRPAIGKRWTDKHMLVAARSVLVVFTCGLTGFALNSGSSMYEMVQYAYRVTLVAAFVPLVFGMFWRRATPRGAMFAMICGLGSWITCELTAGAALFPPQLVGLLCSAAAMIAGSLLPQRRAELHAATTIEGGLAAPVGGRS